MPRASRTRTRQRGAIDERPSGALRVRVYAGIDPVTKRAHYLVEHVPAGPRAAGQAEKVRIRLLAQVDEKRNPRTNATLNQLLDRYMSVLDIEATTRDGYERNLRNHVRPVLGDLPISRIDGELIDSFYAQLRSCRARCRGRTYVEHRTKRHHQCDDRCRPHQCRPLSDASRRHIHNLLSGAFGRAVRWRWVSTNPVHQAEAPSQPVPHPRPPSQPQAARIAMEAWKDPDWGMFVWLAMTTGARRGELCALRWDRLHLESGVLEVRTSIAQSGRQIWEKDTKTHQQRRIVLDPQTLDLLRAYLRHCTQRAASIGLELPPDSYVFSLAPDASTWLKPDTVTQRYTRMCARLGFDMHIHQLRHYSATELIAGGVDIRTVAGRLGHGGGGTTTLRVYSAWVAEADQRAAKSLGSRMPILPSSSGFDAPELPAPATQDNTNPYQIIAADLRAAIRCGALRPGDPLPTIKQLASQYGVAVSTAHRAIMELTAANDAVASRGKRAIVR